MKGFTKWVYVLLAVVIVFWSTNALAEVGVTDDTIKIGVVSDLTGPTAIGGVGMADGIVSFFKDLNEKGGINGRKVEVIVEDCAYSPAKAVAAAKKLMAKDGVFALVSPWGTAPSTALFPIAKKQKIPIVPACSLATSVYDPLKRQVFAVGTNYVDQSLFVVDYIRNELGIKKPKIGLFCQDDDWGRDHLKGLEMARKKYDLPPITMETYKYNAVDFKSQVINLRRAKPDVVLIASGIKSGAMFLKEAQKLNWKPTFIGSNTLGTYCDPAVGRRIRKRVAGGKYFCHARGGHPGYETIGGRIQEILRGQVDARRSENSSLLRLRLDQRHGFCRRR